MIAQMVRAVLFAMATVATRTGFRASRLANRQIGSANANTKLTFDPDHLVGADQSQVRKQKDRLAAVFGFLAKNLCGLFVTRIQKHTY